MNSHIPFGPENPRHSRISRRTLLRSGLAISPVIVLGAWAGKNARTVSRASAKVSAAATRLQVPACVVTPQLTEGPYFVDEQLFRSDIRTDPVTSTVKDGMPMRLGFQVYQVGGDSACSPLAGAVVDVWHCDALGVYSDVTDPSFNTKGQKWLRGAQMTDDSGNVEFTTIYPGWYQGRTVHTHFKVRTHPNDASGYEFTSQVFFDDTLTDTVHAQQPYAAKGPRTLRNDGDGIFQQSSGQLTLQMQLSDDGSMYVTTFAVGVDLSAPAPSGPQGGPPPGGGPPRPAGG